jgi:hypothetical protein
MSLIIGEALWLHVSPMNQRRARSRVSDDSVMRDTTMEMRDLRVPILHAGTSRMRLSHVVRGPCLDPLEAIPAVLSWSTAWSTCHLWESHADHCSSGATTHNFHHRSSTSSPTLLLHCNSRWQHGHHSSSCHLGTRATTTGRLGFLPRIAISLSTTYSSAYGEPIEE